MFGKKTLIAMAVGAVAVYVFMNKDKFFGKKNGTDAGGNGGDLAGE